MNLDSLVFFFAAKAQEEKTKGVSATTDGEENKPKEVSFTCLFVCLVLLNST